MHGFEAGGAFAAADILIVDDHIAMREMLRRMLSAAGAGEVREAESADAARSEIARRTPDVIVLDQNMPRESGLDFLRGLRAGAGEQPAVIMLSGYDDAEFRAAAGHAGAEAVLVKPVSAEALVWRLQLALQKRAA
jgi:DNA-binding response OmpR family regulator